MISTVLVHLHGTILMLNITGYGLKRVISIADGLKSWRKYRRESLSTSHRARMSLLAEQLEQASDEKIRRMRQSQISSAEADYAMRIQEMDIAMERADVTADPVAYGVLFVEGQRV